MFYSRTTSVSGKVDEKLFQEEENLFSEEEIVE